jgi:hypothetical protein
VRGVIWATIEDILVQQGLMKSNMLPPTMPEPKPKKPNLRLVKNHADPAGNNSLG